MKGRSLEKDRELQADPRLILSLVVYGYAGLVLLAFWVDGKLYKYRLRKKRAQQGTTPNDRPRFGKDDPRGPKKR